MNVLTAAARRLRRALSENEREAGPDLMQARVHGNSVPELKLAALDRAREFYGADAALRITGMSSIATSEGAQAKGRFWTYVLVRCLNFHEYGDDQ